MNKISYLGHLMRRAKYELPKLIFSRQEAGVGIRNVTPSGNIRLWTDLNFDELIRTTQDRHAFAYFE